MLWTETSHSESGMLSAFTPLSVEKRRGYRTGRERGESNKEPAWVSKSLNSQLSETTWWTARVWEAGSDARHPPWLHSTAPTRPMSRRKEMVRLHHGTYGCHAACSFLSRCSYGGCSQVVWKQLGLLQIEITGGIGVLEPALRQMAWTKQSEEKRDGRPCRKPSGGVVHREGTTTRWIWGQPLVPPPTPPPPCHPLGMLCLRASWRSPTWNLVIPLSWSHGARPSPNRIRHSNRNASNCSLCAYLPGKKFGRMGWEADADIPILVSAWVFKANVFKQLNFKWGICSAVRKANCLHWRQIKHCK